MARNEKADFIYFLGEMLELSPPSYIFQKGDALVIPNSGISVLYGKPGVGKSFIALDIAFQIALSGKPTLYICSEGGFDYGRRCKSWLVHNERYNNSDIANIPIFFIPFHFPRLYAFDTVAPVIEASKHMKIEFAVIDTLNRVSRGADENNANDMEVMLDNAEKIAPSVLLVHHTNRSGKDYRGSSAIEGNCTAMLELREERSGDLRLGCVKNKYGPEFKPLHFQLIQVEESLVAIDSKNAAMPGNAQKITAAIQEHFGEATRQQILDISNVPVGSFNKSIQWLITAGMVVEHNGVYKINGIGGFDGS